MLCVLLFAGIKLDPMIRSPLLCSLRAYALRTPEWRKKPSSYMCVLRNIKSRFSQIIIQFSALAEWAEKRESATKNTTNKHIFYSNKKF